MYVGRGSVYMLLVVNLKVKDHTEDTGEDGRIVLKWMFTMWGVGVVILMCYVYYFELTLLYPDGVECTQLT
jgi:hypothetical protein